MNDVNMQHNGGGVQSCGLSALSAKPLITEGRKIER